MSGFSESQWEVDTLYQKLASIALDRKLRRLFRKCYNSSLKEGILGLTVHLLSGGDYRSLLTFSNMYKKKYVLPELIQFINEDMGKRIVDLGSGGLDWGRKLAQEKGMDYMCVDKRKWDGVDLVLDVEREDLREYLKDGDILLMSEFIHCVDDLESLRPLEGYPWVIVEPNLVRGSPLWRQLKEFGGNPRSIKEILTFLNEREWVWKKCGMYHLVKAAERGRACST